ncbi:MAG: class I SAM-dependent methyltransferase, partial [Sporomusa sp.]
RSLDAKKLDLLVNMAEFGEGDTVLDVGCGTGVLSPFLKKAVGDTGQITAIDFAVQMIARAIDNNKHIADINYITGDINKFEAETPFDKIICLNFFPHISDKPAFAEKMKAILKPGGSLIIMHDISRKAVNSLHARSTAVKDDVLPDVNLVAAMLQSVGYSILNAMENDELYFVKAVKERGGI